MILASKGQRNKILFATFALIINTFWKRATVDRYSIKIPQLKVHMIKRWLSAHTLWGMSIGGIRQYHVREWNPGC